MTHRLVERNKPRPGLACLMRGATPGAYGALGEL